MEQFGYYKHGDLSPEAIAAMRRELAVATREVSDFTISFVSRQQALGSGTLVTAHGEPGVLTAFHVAEELQSREEPFGMIISEQIHQFIWDLDWINVVPIGKPIDRTHPELGPDLAFIRLLEPQKLGTLRSKKSFYRLDGRSFEQWRKYPYQNMSWWIAGSPAEFSSSTGEFGTGQHILSATHFHAEATFESFEDRGDFDFVQLEVTSGAHRFPANYGGVSGGGIWLAPLAMDPDVGPTTLRKEPPFLVGTAFVQSPDEGQKRHIIGHGPKSLYSAVLRALAK
jgi:hypothetical protein